MPAAFTPSPPWLGLTSSSDSLESQLLRPCLSCFFLNLPLGHVRTADSWVLKFSPAFSQPPCVCVSVCVSCPVHSVFSLILSSFSFSLIATIFVLLCFLTPSSV